MNKIIKNLLNGTVENRLLPFFWQHGEDEETLRKYMSVIQNANCGAVCVESRPHPDFCGPKWWRDMDIILDEAEKRGMKVWILDDSHFPTGYANGALENADPSLCRQSVVCHFLNYDEEPETVVFDLEVLSHPPIYKLDRVSEAIVARYGKQREFDDDTVYSITAFGSDGEMLDLTGLKEWQKPGGKWQVVVCSLSRNCGPHRNYINMMNAESCKILLDTVHEAHYTRYKEYFGNVIAGFFSDEPELGNGILYAKYNKLGTEQDLPWSKELEEALGEGFKNKLPLLWKNDFDGDAITKARVTYMDTVTKLVKKDFSDQVGDWCRVHGVEYIGHIIEDDDTHTCTASGLGHFFRGLSGQDMSGIDDIGGQVLPGGEVEPTTAMYGARPRNGGFYHYTLAKLGVSAAYLDPKKKGRTMCEIFGNYGWKAGVNLMKYLADHFMVRGVNYFVPHAFSPKEYPDPDCPPHFFAHGNNPQYRHFGELCGYMNRVANLITDGEIPVKVAILYNAEADWAGECMLMDKPAAKLMDAQIDFMFLPIDSLEKASDYKFLIVPYGKYWPEAIEKVKNAVFVDALPDNFNSGKVVKLDDLTEYLSGHGIREIVLEPADNRIRCLHYVNENDIYYFVNESAQTYEGFATVPSEGACYNYNAWDNRLESIKTEGNKVWLSIEPKKSMIVIFDNAEGLVEPLKTGGKANEISVWKRSVCRSIDYPDFSDKKEISLPDSLAKEKPEFSGYVRYEAEFEAKEATVCILEITDAAEGVEVYVNDVSAGIQIVPVFRYDISKLVYNGTNLLRIEVATTLERENAKKINPMFKAVIGEPTSDLGITGKVFLWER